MFDDPIFEMLREADRARDAKNQKARDDLVALVVDLIADDNRVPVRKIIAEGKRRHEATDGNVLEAIGLACETGWAEVVDGHVQLSDEGREARQLVMLAGRKRRTRRKH